MGKDDLQIMGDFMSEYEELYKCEYRKSHGIIGKTDAGWYILAGSVISEAPTNSFASREKAEIKNLKSRRLTNDIAVSSKTMAVSVLGRHGVDRLTADRYTGKPVNKSEAEAYLKEDVDTDISASNNETDIKSDKTEAIGEYLERVDALIGDERFLKLDYLHNKNNIFKILGQTHTEHWHSSFFKWLLDPNSTLGLGSFPLERFIFMCLSKMNDENKLLDINHFFEKVLNLFELEFETEHNVVIYDGKYYGWKKGSLDIYACNENFELVIENKVTAREEIKKKLKDCDYGGPDAWGQTDMYYDSITKSSIEEKGENKKDYLFVFLTPDESMKPNCNKFVHITYQEMYDHVIKKCIAHPEIAAEQKFILEDYANNLSEPYKINEKNSSKEVQHPMALTNISLCEALYNTYTSILDDIYEAAKTNGNVGSAVTKMLSEVYRAHSSEFNEIYLSVDGFDATPSSTGKMYSNRISFTNLCREGKIHEDEIIYLVSGGNKLYAQFYKDGNECYLRLLDSAKKPIDDYDKYTQAITSLSSAADYAIRLSKGNPDDQKKVYINGRDAWKVDGTDQSAQEWYN